MTSGVNRDNAMFSVAVPYGVGSLAIGTIGAVISLTAVSQVAIIAGVVLSLIGAYTFLGTIGVYFSSRNVEEFNQNIGKGLVTAAGSAIAAILSQVAQMVLINLIFGDRRR